jgi:hypothetical protein
MTHADFPGRAGTSPAPGPATDTGADIDQGIPAVLCTGLTYRFGAHTAVDGVDLRIEPGQPFGLLARAGQDHHDPDADHPAQARSCCRRTPP